ncbi:MAG TPA: helicase-associated domain-containing protein, partial [Gemmataceae bacterium]|nr:helicase-associated domain-containing protein [Gemmataceae bacterium]
GPLLEMLAALGHAEGPRPVITLLEGGLLVPDLPAEGGRLKNFDQWLGRSGTSGLRVLAHPHVTARAVNEDLGLPSLSPGIREVTNVQEADGLDWPLRLAGVWQMIVGGPLRQTQGGEFFKRDQDRLRSDPLLNSPFSDSPGQLPDIGLLAVMWALGESILHEKDGEIRAADFPSAWNAGLSATLESLWCALLQLNTWNPSNGWQDARSSANPYPAAYLLALLLLAHLPESSWTYPASIDQWILEHHPFWKSDFQAPSGPTFNLAPRPAPLSSFLLGLAHALRLVQVARDPQGEWVIRLSEFGRCLLGFSPVPNAVPNFPKTLLVQPNLEIIAYRQGLTPNLVVSLSRFAAWKSLGSACTLQLQPDTAYRALESGWTLENILQTLEQYSMRSIPSAVIESLRTWADKRERLNIYAAAALFEFAVPEDLEEALARGLAGLRLTDRLLLVPNEEQIDYRHFRLTGTRDYGLPPDQCVEIAGDGVTLTIDSARSDLLLETELRRFAEIVERPGSNAGRQYRLTPDTLASGRESGLGLAVLETWFQQRTGQPLTPAARLLLTGFLEEPMPLRQVLVLQVSKPEVADGLLQWPATKELIQGRLGPTALIIAPEQVESLRERLGVLGLNFQMETDAK